MKLKYDPSVIRECWAVLTASIKNNSDDIDGLITS